jgi:pimeloyl-ACP methyl ester carboxylesterase
MSQFARDARRIMLILFSALLIFGLAVLGVLLALSPGQPQPFVDGNGTVLPGSISEKVFVTIGGVKQGMFIQSRDERNPVLLYLHGGMPDYFLTRRYPTGLENHFTVVWWEQRGSGISYSGSLPPGSLTLAQLVSDTVEVTNFLRFRFGREKIYLMGHSGGTFIGVHVAAQAPELFHAYIGVAQMSNQLKSETLAYDFMLARFREAGNTSMVRKLEAAPVTLSGGIPDAYLALRDGAMHGLGVGTTRDMSSVITGIFLPSLTSPDYTLVEKFNMWRGKSRSGVSSLWREMTSTDLSEKVPALRIPVYFLEGIYDYTCSYAEAKSYFEKLAAPVKGFYTFEHSAHSPLFEEPERTLTILRDDVLAGVNNHADKP